MGQPPDETPESANRSAEDGGLDKPGSVDASHNASSPPRSLAPDFTGPLRATYGPVLSNCPPEDDWLDLAADILNKEDSTRLLEHAANCDRCSVLLREAEHITSDEADPQQEHLLSSLATSNTADQKRIAIRMAQITASPEQRTANRTASRSWFQLPQWRWAMATAVVALLVGSLVLARLARRDTPATLIARAYTETRTLPTRVPGAHHSPVHQIRGSAGSAFESPLPLLQATADISAGLRSHPDDPALLALRGRAELVSGDIPSAIASLQRSLELQPSDFAKIDLASALAARAASQQHAEDLGTAIELLSEVLRNTPDQELALFNRAVVEEQAHLHQQAISDWERYLQAHPSGEWADEARQRLSAVRQLLQRSQAEPPSPDPAAFLQFVSSQNAPESMESYFDVALGRWLAEANGPGSAASTNSALRTLAAKSRELHRDTWWLEVLAQPSRHQNAVEHLAAAHRANLSGDYRLAATEATKAESEPAGAPTDPVRLAATRERAHATARLVGTGASCRPLHAHLTASLQDTSFRWLQIQNLLDQSSCEARLGDFARASTLIDSALRIARESKYQILELRALGFAAANARVLGELDDAWRLNEEGLLACDARGCPPVRRYQFYDELSHALEEQHRPLTHNIMLREASQAAAATAYHYAEAIDRQRLAQSAFELGDVTSARQEFGRAQELFSSLPPSPEINAYRAEGNIAIAELEIVAGDLDSAQRLLDVKAPLIQQSTNYEVLQKYYRCRSELQLRRNDFAGAEKALLASAAIGDQALSSLSSDADRASWDRESRAAYRDLVDLALDYHHDPVLALNLWEWFKAAPMRAPFARSTSADHKGIAFAGLSTVQLHPPTVDLSQLGSMLIYAVLRNRLIVWSVQAGKVSVHEIATPVRTITEATRRLERLSSDPGSDLASLREQARQLYDWLIPAEVPLPQGSTLSIEVDGALWQVPFNLLMDPAGQYLGDTHQLVFAPAATYVTSNARPRINLRDRLLVVHSQTSEHDGQNLADLAAEASAVVAAFPAAQVIDADRAATPLADELRRAAIFHFAGHAVPRPDGTALVMGENNEGRPRLLTAGQIDNATLPNGKLVVLAACASELGASGGAADSGSLVRAFLRAGVPNVIAAKWPVDSKATSLLMADFYSRLASGAPLPTALSQATRTVRSIPYYSHPYYWAAFNAFGQL